MNREFAESGVFWLPERPDDHVAGVLTFNPETGASLDLIGVFGEPFSSSDLVSYERVHGVAGKKLFTLDACLESN